MKKLTKAQTAERAQLVEKMRAAFANLEVVVDRFNDIVHNEAAEVKNALRAYNKIVQEADDFANSVVADMDAYYDDRSEKWKDSDAGQRYSDWKYRWEGEFSKETIDLPDGVDSPDCDNIDVLESLPEEP